jgi:predicted O-methyltransferase YrrM
MSRHSIEQAIAMTIKTSHDNGHFYSPVVNPEEIASQADQVWKNRLALPGFEFNDSHHLKILDEVFPGLIGDYDYPEHAPADDEELRSFYTRNSQFSWLDSRLLFVLLRHWQPRRIIEVGSGYSSLLMADVNHRFLNDRIRISCIEPYPRPFLRKGIQGLDEVIEKRVQAVSPKLFDELEAGDILFIDSSHVSKTGSDVNELFLEVLPRLKPGVRIHIHDIFLPAEYPREWVVDENRSWNEQYLLRALLIHSSGFRVLFGSNYAYLRFPGQVGTALGLGDRPAYGGGSFWIERCSADQ